MTQADMYKELIRRNRYGYDGCYPSTRYESCHDVDDFWWQPADESYAEKIRKCIKKKKENHMDYNNTKIYVDGRIYKAHDIELTENYGEFPKITATAYLSPSNMVNTPSKNCANKPSKPLTIENVIFNPPATIVFWSDKTKTIVKADYDYESYDPEKGIAMAITKKLMGDNKGKYYELFKHWRKKWDDQNKATEDIKIDIPKNPIEKFAESVRSTLIIDDLLP